VKVFEHATEELLAEDAANGSGGNGGYHFLAQGTLYPDVIESGRDRRQSAHVIKSHHNVGGLPGKNAFELVEPVRQLLRTKSGKQVCNSFAEGDRLPTTVPRSGIGLANSRRSDTGAAPNFTRCRYDCDQ